MRGAGYRSVAWKAVEPVLLPLEYTLIIVLQNLMVGRSLDILDEPNPHETVDKKGENQGGCEEGLGERGGGGQEVQTVFAAVKVDAEQVATPREEENDDGCKDSAVVSARCLIIESGFFVRGG